MNGPSPAALPRVGLGFDVHRFSDDPLRRLVLGGVVFEGAGLEGHSDADPVAHAVADSLLGAAGLGDLGCRFPDTDPAWSGADSLELLRLVSLEVSERWVVANVDSTVVLEAPRLAPHRKEMEGRMAEAVGAPVSIKATRPEALGSLGRREGIACLAVAVLIPR